MCVWGGGGREREKERGFDVGAKHIEREKRVKEKRGRYVHYSECFHLLRSHCYILSVLRNVLISSNLAIGTSL